MPVPWYYDRRVTELRDSESVVFISGGSELLDDCHSAVAVIVDNEVYNPDIPDRNKPNVPTDQVFHGFVECLDESGRGQADAWELGELFLKEDWNWDDAIERLKENFKQDFIGDFGTVIKDVYDLAEQPMGDHPEVFERVQSPEHIFVADGTDMLDNSQRAVAFIARVPDHEKEPGEDRFHAAVEDIYTGGGDGWYPVIENLLPDDDIEELKEKVFKQGYAYGYDHVFKDTYGLDEYNVHPEGLIGPAAQREENRQPTTQEQYGQILQELKELKSLFQQYMNMKGH